MEACKNILACTEQVPVTVKFWCCVIVQAVKGRKTKTEGVVKNSVTAGLENRKVLTQHVLIPWFNHQYYRN